MSRRSMKWAAAVVLAAFVSVGCVYAQGNSENMGQPGFGGPGGPGMGGPGGPPGQNGPQRQSNGNDMAAGILTIDTGAPWSMGDPAKPLSLTRIRVGTAARDVMSFLDEHGYKNIKIERIIEFDLYYYVVLKEKGVQHPATEVIVAPYSGHVYPSPGAATMWNTRYGIRGSLRDSGPAKNDTRRLNEKQAERFAQAFLKAAGGGYKVSSGEHFYGYRSFTFTKDGKIAGILSVNDRTGQVWWDSWLGAFMGVDDTL